MGPFFVTSPGVTLKGEKIPPRVANIRLKKGVREFASAEQAEKSARRSGVGACVWWWDLVSKPILVAEIDRKSEHLDGVVTEVTVAGGRWL